MINVAIADDSPFTCKLLAAYVEDGGECRVVGMAHDALRAAAALGMSQDAFVELIRASSGRSYGFEVRARMPPPEKFRHPGELLAKDVRLLGEVLGDGDPAFRPLRDSAVEFLSYVLGAAEG